MLIATAERFWNLIFDIRNIVSVQKSEISYIHIICKKSDFRFCLATLYWKTWYGGIIDSNTDPGISPGSVQGNITLGFYTPPPRYTHPHLIPSKRGKARMASWYCPLPWKILQTPFGRPPTNFIQDWGHMGLFIAGEKRAKLTNIFYILFWWNSMANYSLLVRPKSPRNLETGSKHRNLYLTKLLCLYIVTSPRSTLWRLCCLLCISQNLNRNTICTIQDSDKARILIHFVITAAKSIFQTELNKKQI